MKKLFKLNEKNFVKQKISNYHYQDKENNLNYCNYADLLKKKRQIIDFDNYSNSNNCCSTVSLINKNNISKKDIMNLNYVNDLSFKNDVEIDIDYLSKNMEKSCFVSMKNISKVNNANKNINFNFKNESNEKSPLRYYFEKDSVMNEHLKNYKNDKSKSRNKCKTDDMNINRISIVKSINESFGTMDNQSNNFKTIIHKNQTLVKEKSNERSFNKYKPQIKSTSLMIFKSPLNIKKKKIPNITTFDSFVNNIDI